MDIKISERQYLDALKIINDYNSQNKKINIFDVDWTLREVNSINRLFNLYEVTTTADIPILFMNNFTKDDIRKIKYCGRKTANSIFRKLEQNGIFLN